MCCEVAEPTSPSGEEFQGHNATGFLFEEGVAGGRWCPNFCCSDTLAAFSSAATPSSDLSLQVPSKHAVQACQLLFSAARTSSARSNVSSLPSPKCSGSTAHLLYPLTGTALLWSYLQTAFQPQKQGTTWFMEQTSSALPPKGSQSQMGMTVPFASFFSS